MLQLGIKSPPFSQHIRVNSAPVGFGRLGGGRSSSQQPHSVRRVPALPDYLPSPENSFKGRQRACEGVGAVLCLALRGTLFFLKRLS